MGRNQRELDLNVSLNLVKPSQRSIPKTSEKRIMLWDWEIKVASCTPAPNLYKVKDDLTKTTRNAMRNFGLGEKITNKKIKLTPGPSDYDLT